MSLDLEKSKAFKELVDHHPHAPGDNPLHIGGEEKIGFAMNVNKKNVAVRMFEDQKNRGRFVGDIIFIGEAPDIARVIDFTAIRMYSNPFWAVALAALAFFAGFLVGRFGGSDEDHTPCTTEEASVDAKMPLGGSVSSNYRVHYDDLTNNYNGVIIEDFGPHSPDLPGE